MWKCSWQEVKREDFDRRERTWDVVGWESETLPLLSSLTRLPWLQKAEQRRRHSPPCKYKELAGIGFIKGRSEEFLLLCTKCTFKVVLAHKVLSVRKTHAPSECWRLRLRLFSKAIWYTQISLVYIRMVENLTGFQVKVSTQTSLGICGETRNKADCFWLKPGLWKNIQVLL